MDELFEQFMIEGRELISQATDDLTALERDPTTPGRIDSAFRAVHTLKGSVAIFDLAPMNAALHSAEDVLGAIRARSGAIEMPLVQALLACIDQCDRWMDVLAETNVLPLEASKDAMRIATGLAALTGAGPAEGESAGGSDAAWLAPLLAREAARLAALGPQSGPLVAIRYTPREDCFFTGDDPIAFAAAIPELVALDVAAREPWPPLEDFDPYRCNLIIEALSSAALPDLRQLFRFIPDQIELAVLPAGGGAGADEAAAPAAETEAAEKTIRVEAAQIDALLDIVGELLVAKNALAHLAGEAEAGMDRAALAAALRANHAVSERLIASVHRTVMNVRMIPLERVFRRLGRLVREIAVRVDREVALSVHGAETRVDKAIVDALFEPLLHIIRNAIDHGIEPAALRRELGKPATGALTLSARAVGDQIWIDVADDGAGIDPERMRRTAIERGMSEEDLATLDDAGLAALIFAPGFSTADRVTDVSGRGVGMDAVKVAIERLGGRVGLASRKGAGTTISLRLPATAALTTVLLVEIAGERLAVPIDVVSETLRLPRSRIVPVGHGRAFVHRGRTIPLLSLGSLLGLAAEPDGAALPLLVVDTGQGPVGIAVDGFSERLDVMLRPMTGLLSRLPGVSGTTLLGDGSVLLILNLSELIG